MQAYRLTSRHILLLFEDIILNNQLIKLANILLNLKLKCTKMTTQRGGLYVAKLNRKFVGESGQKQLKF